MLSQTSSYGSMSEHEPLPLAEVALNRVEFLNPDVSLQSQGGEVSVRGLYSEFLNATRIRIGGETVDLGRVITDKSPNPHGLDKNILVAIGQDELYEFVVRSGYDGLIENWEDPRHIVVGDHALIGVTAILSERGKDGEILFSPGFIWAHFEEGYLVSDSVRVYERLNGEHFQARDITPLEVLPDGSIRFIARLEREDHFHTLSYYIAHTDGEITLERELKIPMTKWGSYKYGTVGAPIAWGEDGQQLLFIHGQERRPMGSQGLRSYYTIGAVVLDKEGNIIQITREPLIARTMVPFAPELRDENSVLYGVDTPRDKGDDLAMLLCAGDITTVELRIAKGYINRRLVPIDMLEEVGGNAA